MRRYANLRRTAILSFGSELAMSSAVQPMPLLPNYLRIKRKQMSLSQWEVAFLLGMKGMDKYNKVSRDENQARSPTLETALAYPASPQGESVKSGGSRRHVG
jgi:hypothetical protein